MSAQGLAVSATAVVALVFGGAVIVVATVLAVRGRSVAASLWWVVLAGLGQAMLGLAVAAQDPQGDGARAAALQLLTIAAAAALRAACSGSGGGKGEESGPDWLSPVGRCLVWASLIGAPGTIGFHAKVVLVRSLLSLDWSGMSLLVLAAGAAATWPALAALRAPHPGPLRGIRRMATYLLVGVVLLLGLYPHWAVTAADWVARVAFS
jgi:hypothetical protein